MITAAAGPTEKKMTTGIRYAKAGMICAASSTGVISRSNRSERPATMPSGTPTSSDSATATSISDSVCMLSSQRPRAANDAKLATMITPARRPPNRHASSPPRRVVPGHVSHFESRW